MRHDGSGPRPTNAPTSPTHSTGCKGTPKANRVATKASIIPIETATAVHCRRRTSTPTTTPGTSLSAAPTAATPAAGARRPLARRRSVAPENSTTSGPGWPVGSTILAGRARMATEATRNATVRATSHRARRTDTENPASTAKMTPSGVESAHIRRHTASAEGKESARRGAARIEAVGG